jgi:integrase/recombinase XerD
MTDLAITSGHDLDVVRPGINSRTLTAAWLASYSSANTRAAYARDLAAWVEWLDGVGVDLLAARRPHVDAWARCLESDGLRPSTVARHLAALSSFYRYAEDVEVIDRNPARSARRPRTGEGHVELTPALDRAEVLRLISAAGRPWERALVLVLTMQGLRVSEALALDLDGVTEVRGHRTALVQGKGGRSDRVPLPPVVVDALLAVAADEGRSTGPVFVGADGQRMSRHSVGRALSRLGRAAGIPRTVGPHMLRATAITGALDGGATLRDVQDFARHADPRTTRRYDRGRGSLDRHSSYVLAAWLTDDTTDERTSA